jgi:signal transduction histidine kinase
MILEGRVLGAVEILNHKDGYYSDADANLLEMVGSQAALAIEYVKATEKRSLDERMATVGSMAASIIHDLRNSMQVIGGYTQLIAMESPSTTRYCDIIRGEIDKLIGMSQELLEYSRGNKIQLSCVTVGLNAFVSSIYSFNKESLEQLAIELNFESDNDAQISIDVDKMTRVLQNIVNNARDSLESRDVKKISLFAGLRDGVPAIGVIDTGKGMDQQTLESLFKPFFTKGKKGGTGLGMAIVKNILSAHGAVIQVESEPDKGSSFWISFPESQE